MMRMASVKNNGFPRRRDVIRTVKPVMTCVFLIGILFAFEHKSMAAPSPVAIRTVKGKVEIREDQGKSWRTAVAGDTLGEGWQIKTGLDGEALLVWPQGHAVKVLSLTFLTVKNASSDRRTENTSLNISNGKIFSKVKKLGSNDSTFEVRTPTARLQPSPPCAGRNSWSKCWRITLPLSLYWRVNST